MLFQILRGEKRVFMRVCTPLHPSAECNLSKLLCKQIFRGRAVVQTNFSINIHRHIQTPVSAIGQFICPCSHYSLCRYLQVGVFSFISVTYSLSHEISTQLLSRSLSLSHSTTHIHFFYIGSKFQRQRKHSGLN